MRFWEPFKIERGKEYHWQIGPLKMWLKKIEDEWLVASEQSPNDLESEEIVIANLSEKPETPEWTRFVCAGPDTMQLLPALPDRAVVVGSEMAVKILQENSALFFVTIPVWVCVYAGDKKETMLTEIPTVSLSNTWFGDPMTGELCYSLQSRAGMDIKHIPLSPHKAVCPVLLVNSSTGLQPRWQR